MRIAGFILMAIGLVWTLQGAGILGFSLMTGSRFWLWAGVAFLVAGLGLAGWSLLRR